MGENITQSETSQTSKKKKWILWHVNYISVKVLFKINMCIDESDSKVRETS